MQVRFQHVPYRLNLLLVKGVIVKPISAPPTTSRRTVKTLNSAKFFSIASLQEYTNSFSPENLVGSGMLATVYKAELPNGKVRFYEMMLVSYKLVGYTHATWRQYRCSVGICLVRFVTCTTTV
ncbi:hypothetical protein Hdeb2414_s0394g00884511 [Helianthus debilis subsp. tardiflorus]